MFSPTVIDMSHAGASGVSGWLGDIHAVSSPVERDRRVVTGLLVRLSVPPATITWSIPAMMLPAAICTALRPAAQ